MAAREPDIVVIATGSEPNLPDRRGRLTEDRGIAERLGRHVLPSLPGLDLPRPFVRRGAVRRRDPVGPRVVFDVNGHWEAAGTAEFLADRGCDVELITPSLMAGSDLEGGTRTLFYRRAAIKKIRFRTATTVTAIEPGRVQIRPVFGPQPSDSWDRYLIINGEAEWLAGVDAVVAVIGRRSREDLFHACKEFPGPRRGQGRAGRRLRRATAGRKQHCGSPRFRHEHLAIRNLG